MRNAIWRVADFLQVATAATALIILFGSLLAFAGWMGASFLLTGTWAATDWLNWLAPRLGGLFLLLMLASLAFAALRDLIVWSVGR